MAFIVQVDTETTTNGNLATALLVSTFTNTTRIRKLFINVFADQVAGNGDYTCFLKVQRAGAGSAYEAIRTTKAVASGVTAIMFSSIAITLNATDVLTVFLLGLAGDTTTPDIIVDVNEELPETAAIQTTVDDIPTNAELATALGTADDAILTQVALVKAATDNLPADPADASVVAGLIAALQVFVDTEVAAILAAVDTEVAAILALLDDARTEPGQGAPPVNPDLATKIDYLYKAWRNRNTQTATEYALYADNTTTKDHKAAVADDGTTFDRAEVGTGA